MTQNGGPEAPEPLRSTPGFVVRRMYQAYTSAWARHVDATLTGPQFAVLVAVSSWPEVDQGTLAAGVSLDRSTMADVCRRLETRGLIGRVPAPTDSRRKLVHLTEDGQRVLTEVRERAERLKDALLADADAVALLTQLGVVTTQWESVAARDSV